MADEQAGYSGVVYSEYEAPYTGAEGYTGVVRGTTASGYTGATSAPSSPPETGATSAPSSVLSSPPGRSEVDPIPVIPGPPLEAPADTGERASGSIELGGLPIIDAPPSYEGVVLDESVAEPTEIVLEESEVGDESVAEPTEIVFEEYEVEPIVARPPSYDGVIIFEESEVEPIIATVYSEYEAGGSSAEVIENVVEEDFSKVGNGKPRPSYAGSVQGRSASGYKGVTRAPGGPPVRSEVDPIPVPVIPPGAEGYRIPKILPDRSKIPRRARDKRKYKDCADFARSQPLSKALVKAGLMQKVSKIETSEQPDGTWKAQATLNYSLDPEQSVITKFPDPSWPDMTPSEKAALDKSLDALLVHELGHLRITEDYAKAMPGRQIKVHSTKTGPEGETEAVKKLRARARRDYNDEVSVLETKQNIYNAVTEHGQRQSAGPWHGFPGGDDAKFNCPVD